MTSDLAQAITQAAPSAAVPPAEGAMISRDTAAAGISPKTNAAAIGAAIATIFWSVATATFWKGAFSDATLAALTGATATLLGYVLSYLQTDVLRRDGGQ